MEQNYIEETKEKQPELLFWLCRASILLYESWIRYIYPDGSHLF